METFEVLLQLKGTSQPILFQAVTTYQKGDFYCVVYMVAGTKVVDKFPVADIFRVREEYKYIATE